ncbi:MAG: hypothetical protein D6759_01140, partial [Chloroflexi bacterium]
MFDKGRFLASLLTLSLLLTAFSSPFQATERQKGIPRWVWVLIILLLLGLLFWWWLRGRREEAPIQPSALRPE